MSVKLYLAGVSLLFSCALPYAQQPNSLNEANAPLRSMNVDAGGATLAETSSALAPVQPHSLTESTAQIAPVVEVLSKLLGQYRKSGNRDGEANILCALGNSYNAMGQQQKAIEQFQLAADIYRSTGDHKGEGNALSHLGGTYRNWGFPDLGIRFFHQSLDAFSHTDDKHGRAVALNNLGVTYLMLKNKRKALDYLNQAREGYRDAGDLHGEALAIINIGATLDFLGHDPQKALTYFEDAVSRLEAQKDVLNEADAFELIGLTWAGLHRNDTAESSYQRSLALYRQVGNPKGEASVEKHLRQLHDLDIASTH